MPWNKADYSPRWAEIRSRILERDGHRCKQCGISNYTVGRRAENGKLVIADFAESYAEGRQLADEATRLLGWKHIVIVLTISHSCHDSKCEDEEHLSAKCQQCHLRTDRLYHATNARATWRRKKHRSQLELWDDQTAIV